MVATEAGGGMKVGDIMTSEVLTLKADDPVRTAAELAETKGLRRFPVVDSQGALIGILTDRDLKNASASSIVLTQKKSHDFLLDSTKVETLMTAAPRTVTPDTAVEDAARIILEMKVGGLPVVDGGRLVGIVTETDLINALLELLSSG
jgi:acetoin utilization protein AcuB